MAPRSTARTGQRRSAEAPPAARTRRPAPKPEPVEEPAGRDVTVYLEKEPTPFHKAFAKWIVTEVGYRPSQADSLKAAFLAGVSLATVTRAAFNDSQWLEDWREENGVNKRGRKRADEVQEEEAAAPAARRRRKPEPEPEPEAEDDDDFEDDDDDADDDADFDDDDADDADDDFEEEAPTPAPVKRGPGRPRKAAPEAAQPPARARAARSNAAASTRRTKPADDDFAF